MNAAGIDVAQEESQGQPNLRLAGEDGDDLSIMSAAVQDAIFKIRDIVFDQKTRRFSLALNRFRWEKAGRHAPYWRVRAALSFSSVIGVQTLKLRKDAPEATGVILSIGFVPGPEAPAGLIVLNLAGGGMIRLDVECVDAVLLDVGTPWATPHKPVHEGKA